MIEATSAPSGHSGPELFYFDTESGLYFKVLRTMTPNGKGQPVLSLTITVVDSLGVEQLNLIGEPDQGTTSHVFTEEELSSPSFDAQLVMQAKIEALISRKISERQNREALSSLL